MKYEACYSDFIPNTIVEDIRDMYLDKVNREVKDRVISMVPDDWIEKGVSDIPYGENITCKLSVYFFREDRFDAAMVYLSGILKKGELDEFLGLLNDEK